MVTSHILGFPRIGPKRETKRAVEAYWKKKLTQEQLIQKGLEVRKQIVEFQKNGGLDLVSVGDFTWYDHVLDTSVMFNVIPERFADAEQAKNNRLDLMFRCGRGRAPTGKDAPACSMTKWFDTNYHYMVPEFVENQEFSLNMNGNKLLSEIKETIGFGVDAKSIKPIIVGPVTYLWLGTEKKTKFNRLSLLPKLLPVYTKLLAEIKALGVEWVQIDEPILGLDVEDEWRTALSTAYGKIAEGANKPQILIATYFVDVADNNIATALALPVQGLHLDLVRGPDQIKTVVPKFVGTGKVVSFGVVNGRNVWRNNLSESIALLKPFVEKLGADKVWVSSSCSLQHSPVDLENEPKLSAELKQWFAFAKQKIDEISVISNTLAGKTTDATTAAIKASDEADAARKASKIVHDDKVKERVKNITPAMFKRAAEYSQRAEAQQKSLNLPKFPTTTIGSFPQTLDIRKCRRAFKNGTIPETEYIEKMQSEIKDMVGKQEELGIDVLVHGEPERNDMVEYFGELLDGFAFTSNGWVQSYGSRCVKPPIIYGDVKRSKPMTNFWIKYAQSLTGRLMKGMLTGPVTILCWSFERDDQPKVDTCYQIALAIRDEVLGLEKDGIKVIQIDEPAFREGLPIRKSEQAGYLDWAVKSFQLSTGGNELSNATQIHTHMCYSEFNVLIHSIADMDADVITIETSRADMKLLDAFENFKYPNEIGPGVYDIHSPRVPPEEEMLDLLQKAAKKIEPTRLWVNPDCGLKTRGWTEVMPALEKMVSAARKMRVQFA